MKFNEPASAKDTTSNYEGAPAYTESPEMALYTLVCTSLVEDQYYRPKEQALKELFSLIGNCQPEYVAKLSIFARKEMNLRSIPVAMVVTLAMTHKHPSVKKAIMGVIQRVDEITEVLSFYSKVNDNRTKQKPLTKIPSIIKSAIKEVFESGRFDEYQFAKYDRTGDVKLKDALFLTHPKPRSESLEDGSGVDKQMQERLFKKIAESTLETPFTWETELSKGKDRKETWESLIESKKVGYMATLRNLRNITQANISDAHILQVAEFISSDTVYKAKQFPFRFWSAYRELKELPMTRKTQLLIGAVDKAILKSVKSYPPFKENVLIACDTSGSMNEPLSKKSSLQYYEIGLVLGALLSRELPNSIVGQFATNWEIMTPVGTVLNTAECFIAQSGNVGWSTNGHLAIKYLIDHKVTVDQVLMFTDCQLWNGSYGNDYLPDFWTRYTSTINKDAELWIFDLAGYGDTPIRIDGNVHLIAGWNDRIFEAVNRIKGGQSIVDMINGCTI